MARQTRKARKFRKNKTRSRKGGFFNKCTDAKFKKAFTAMPGLYEDFKHAETYYDNCCHQDKRFDTVFRPLRRKRCYALEKKFPDNFGSGSIKPKHYLQDEFEDVNNKQEYVNFYNELESKSAIKANPTNQTEGTLKFFPSPNEAAGVSKPSKLSLNTGPNTSTNTSSKQQTGLANDEVIGYLLDYGLKNNLNILKKDMSYIFNILDQAKIHYNKKEIIEIIEKLTKQPDDESKSESEIIILNEPLQQVIDFYPKIVKERALNSLLEYKENLNNNYLFEEGKEQMLDDFLEKYNREYIESIDDYLKKPIPLEIDNFDQDIKKYANQITKNIIDNNLKKEITYDNAVAAHIKKYEKPMPPAMFKNIRDESALRLFLKSESNYKPAIKPNQYFLEFFDEDRNLIVDDPFTLAAGELYDYEYTKLLNNFLKSKNFRVYNVRGDGNCYVYSILLAFGLIKLKNSVDESQLRSLYRDEKKYALQVRAIIGKYMETNGLLSYVYKKYFLPRINGKILTSIDPIFGYIKNENDFLWYFLTSNFFFDDVFIGLMQSVFNYQTIIITKSENNKFSVSCRTPVNYEYPNNFIIVLNSRVHYLLVTYKENKIFTFQDLPQKIKELYKSSCNSFNEVVPRTVGSLEPSPYTEIFGKWLNKEKGYVFGVDGESELNSLPLKNMTQSKVSLPKQSPKRKTRKNKTLVAMFYDDTSSETSSVKSSPAQSVEGRQTLREGNAERVEELNRGSPKPGPLNVGENQIDENRNMNDPVNLSDNESLFEATTRHDY
jgi:hypothetical protein